MAQQAVVQVARHGCVVHGKGLQRVLHSVVRGGLPHELSDVALCDVIRHGVVAHLQCDLSLFDAHDVSGTLPGPAVESRRGAVQTQLQLISRHQAQLAVVAPGEVEPRDALVAKRLVPAHGDVLLLLVLLDSAVVLGLELHKRRQDVLVVVAILVVQQRWLSFLIHPGLLYVEKCGLGVRSPHLLQLVDLRSGDLAGPQLLLLAGYLHQPRKECAVLDQWHPLGEVPIHVLQGTHRQTGFTTQQHNDRVVLGGDVSHKEHVAAATIVAFDQRLAQRRIRVKTDLLVSGAHKMLDNVGCRRVSPSIAEPLSGFHAFHYAGLV